MPAAIPFIVQAVATYFAVNAVVVAVVTLIASALVSNYQKRKAQRSARDAYNASLQDRLVMTATANTARSKLYGRVRNTDGVIFKGTWGPNSQNYTLVVAMAAHEIDGFETIFFNDQPVALLSDGVAVSGGVDGGVGYYLTTLPWGKIVQTSSTANITISGGSGTVTFPSPAIAGSASVSMPPGAGEQEDGTYTRDITVAPGGLSGSIVSAPRDGTFQVSYQALVFTPKARIWKYKGGAGQTLYPLLSSRFPALLTATDKFSGMACIVVELTYDQDVFPTGIPSVTAIMRGAKVFDPRNGTTAWTENPALIARDWCLYEYGGGMTVNDVDDASFIAAANACDVSTIFNTTAGNEVRPLYQCGIVCKTDIAPDDHFGEMVEAMAGQSAFSGGKMRVRAGVYRAPVAAMNDTWLNNNANVIVTKDPSKQDLVNNFKPVISNADGYNGTDGSATSIAYTATPMPPLRSTAYIAVDGQELTRETTLLGVTRNVHAQHICGVQMREIRDALMVQMTCNMRAWSLEVFDVVTLTLPVFGFSAKLFEVISWKYTVSEGVALVLKETSPVIYNVSAGIETPDLAINTTLPLPWFVEKVTGVTVTSGATTEDGWPQTRVVVAWNAVANEAIRQSGQIEVQYAEATGVPGSATTWQKWVEQGSATSATLTGLKAGSAYIFRVRALNTLGVAGQWSDQRAHQVAFPPPVGTPQIEVGAATEVLTALDTTVYVNTPTPPALAGTLYVTPAVDCHAIVTFWADYSVTHPGGGFGPGRAATDLAPMTDPPLATGSQVVRFRKSIAVDEIWSQAAVVTGEFELLAGVTYRFYLFYSDFVYSSGLPRIGSQLTNIATRVELIKR